MNRKICLFCERWESGGIESFLFNVLTHGDLAGLEVDLVAAQLCESVFTARLEELGIHFVQLSGDQHDLTANHKAFRELLQARKYDVVHLNIFQGLSLYYAKLAAEAGVPVRIAHSHNTDLRKSATRRLKLLLHRWGCKHYAQYATDFWACSSGAAQFMFGDGEYCFIPNGIETEKFRFDPETRARVREELSCGDKLVIGNVGRLCFQKNQSFLLDVFAQVQKERPDSLLLLVGEGEDRDALQEKAAQLGITDSVIFYGTTDHVERLYWAMDVFAFPSRFEGLPVSLVEAQAAGLPVVCSPAVTREAALVQTTQFVELETELWAQKLVGSGNSNRQVGADVVCQKGFDIVDVAQKLIDNCKGVASDNGKNPAGL